MFKVSELIEAVKGKPAGKWDNTFIRGISIDSRSIKKGEAFIAIKGDNFDGHDFIRQAARKGAACIVKERGINPGYKSKGVNIIEAGDTIKALADIARFWRRRFNIPVIAVTGSNGKTTTKDMAAAVLSDRFKVLKNEGTRNNHIGVPMTLLKLNSGYDMAVLELGTNHPGEIGYLSDICEPNAGIITNIGPSHLKYLRDLKGVSREKRAIIEALQHPRVAILNADDRFLRSELSKKRSKGLAIGFGMDRRSDFTASRARVFNGRTEFLVNKKYKFTLNTPGYYNIYNALAATAAGRIFGIGYADIISRLNRFDFPKGRLRIVESGGVRFIDDSYNSNPLSLKQALRALSGFKAAGRKIFVMGDMLELGFGEKEFHREAGLQASACCDVFITVGRLSKLSARAAESVSRIDSGNIFTCESVPEARRVLSEDVSLKKGDLVLIKGSRLMKMEEIINP